MAREKSILLDGLLFKPGILRSPVDETPAKNLTLNSTDASNIISTSSFVFDSPGSPLKSTQQLNVDFSDFSKHTFFGSVQAKTQVAFTKILNKFPFDGTKAEVDDFISRLSGFEKYIYDDYPKNLGYLAFSGSAGASSIDGNYISVLNQAGNYNPALAKNPNAAPVLNPSTNGFSFEFYAFSPTVTNDNQIIAQFISGSTKGITVAVSSSSDTAIAKFHALVSSGSLVLSATMDFDKGAFQHLGVVYDRKNAIGQVKIYKNGALSASSSLASFGSLGLDNSKLFIGSGSTHSSFIPQETLSGALDEFRYWSVPRTQVELANNQFYNIFAQPGLSLYYRFNEPSGSFSSSNDNLVIDQSGNGLHATVSNFVGSLRNTGTFGLSPPVVGENSKFNPILFPGFQPIIDYSNELLVSGADYDSNNPNLITRLMPPHYLLDAAVAQGLETEKGDIGNEIAYSSDEPGGGKLGQPQIISSMLYIFAETFDELKMFIDEFQRLLKVDVLSQATISDQLLPFLMRYYGFLLPNLFGAANISQDKDGKNVRLDRKTAVSLQKVQNTIWRRILADLPGLLRSRGTMHSLKAALRDAGIDPDGPIRIREYGGAPKREIGDAFIQRKETAAMLDFSGSIGSAGTLDAQGFDSARPHMISSFLSGTRVEPGTPLPVGTVTSIGSTDPSDGLFSSGSWTIEGRYRMPLTTAGGKSSLIRLETTGSTAPSSAGGLLFNVVATAPNTFAATTGSITLYGRPGTASTADTLSLVLTGVNIFDGDKWYVSFGRNRADEIASVVSSSYFLRTGKFTPAGLTNFSVTSSYLYEGSNVLENISTTYNVSGTFMVVGSQSLDATALFLNDTTINSNARNVQFNGRVSNLRFWSKGLTEIESKDHARNYKSLGVVDPAVNFNFVTSASGSFERLRVDASIDQPITKSDSSGNITIFDFSQNGLTFSGTGFEVSKRVIKPERFDFELPSPDFRGEAPNKIRIRSYLSSVKANIYGTSLAPLYEIPQYEEPQDDKRIVIEISSVQALNEDIMNIFATMDYLDTAIGSPELVFSQNYPKLANLRQVYFQRLTTRINLKNFFAFFRWFDSTLGVILEQMLPSDSRFLGTNFIVESHALERPKFVYGYFNIYLGENDRFGNSLLLLQQIVGNTRKF